MCTWLLSNYCGDWCEVMQYVYSSAAEAQPIPVLNIIYTEHCICEEGSKEMAGDTPAGYCIHRDVVLQCLTLKSRVMILSCQGNSICVSRFASGYVLFDPVCHLIMAELSEAEFEEQLGRVLTCSCTVTLATLRESSIKEGLAVAH